MSAFNTSGRKEDISTKLRAQNMKNAKETTKKLEQDNRKMEERLRELKMAMNREKEERERQGGGFWQRGQTGTLTNYASEVLHEKSNKSASKKKKVKVLSDEPLDLPSRKGGPGTMKYIAQRGSPRIELSSKDSKNKGVKCGQCEDRAASLTCVQCSEHYCAGCFAAFHLKGALKRHRSVPLHATGPRQCMSPRPTSPASGRDSSGSGNGGTSGDIFYQQADRHGPSGASGSPDSSRVSGSNSLFDGAYNEADSAASFQEALMAWRRGEKTPEEKTSPQQKVVASPVKSPVVKIESSTSTTDNTQPNMPELKFHTHSLTYAQRLMLKQHRRTDLPSLGGTSTQSSTPTSDLTMVTPRSEVTLVSPRRGPSQTRHHADRDSEDDDDIDENDRVDFQSLFEAVSTTSHSPSSRRTTSGITIIDVTNSPKEQRSASAESSVYSVEEVNGLEAWDLERKARLQEPQLSQAPKAAAENPADTPRQQKRLSKSRETTRVLEKRIPKSRETTHIVDKTVAMHGEDQAGLPQSKVLSSKPPIAEVPQMEEEEMVVPKAQKKPPPAAAAPPRPQSAAKSRPASRAKSAKSRPASRAQSRASSRLAGEEGVLTKAPSSILQEIARRAQAPDAQYQSPMEGFFLAGVKVEGSEESSRSRPVTPAQGRPSSALSRPGTPSQAGKLKVSNKLYAMSPRSWRPDSSVGDAVPLEAVSGLDLSVGNKPPSPTVVRYTYSGQMAGQALSWNPLDSIDPSLPSESAATPVPQDAANNFQTLQESSIFSTPRESMDFQEECATPWESMDLPRETPTPRESHDYPRNTPTPSSRQRKRWQNPEPDARPFSAQRASIESESMGSEARQQATRPNSSTGATEPKKKQGRQLPAIDRDLEGPQKTRALRRKEQSDVWMSDDGSGDTEMRAMSASRTRHWVASQNSLRPDSANFETEVQPFVRESSDIGMGEGDAGSVEVTPRPEDEVTPRPSSKMTPRVSSGRQQPMSARSSASRMSRHEESGRTSRAIVMDGEDLSRYDDDMVRERTAQNKEDMETLDKLEWELASESGRLTADGKISRLSAVEVNSDEQLSSRSGSRSSSVRLSYDQGYDINTKLRDDELSDEAEERAKTSLENDEEEVRALH